MRGRRSIRPLSAVVLASLAACLFPAGAGADLIATLEVPSPDGTNLDLASFDTATGVRLGGPAVNSSANEFHPSIAGNLLAFERQSSCCVDIIVRNTSTGAQADVFHSLEGAVDQPNDPALAPDGSTVITGAPAVPGSSAGTCRSYVASTTFPQFPNGPFFRTQIVMSPDLSNPNPALPCQDLGTLEPLVIGSNPLQVLFVWQVGEGSGGTTRIIAGALSNGNLFGALRAPGPEAIQDPAWSPGTSVMVFEIPGPQVGSNPPPGLYFTRGGLCSTDPGVSGQPVGSSVPVTDPCQIAAMPSPVNLRGALATRPGFSADGRFLAFVRHDNLSGDNRLFVWDSQTQTLLDNTGIDLGTLSPQLAAIVFNSGSVALVNQVVLRITNISLSGAVNFTLVSPSDVGIIVQKVVGRRYVFGRRAPKLRFLGRVPFGHFRRGRNHVKWDFKLGGHRLSPGLYQVTVRSVTAHSGVRGLGQPVLIRIKRPRH
jgi:hypothetical protein